MHKEHQLSRFFMAKKQKQATAKTLGPGSPAFWDFLFVFITIAGVPLLFTRATTEPVLVLRFFILALVLLITVTVFSFLKISKKISPDYSILHRAVFPAFLLYIIFSGISLVAAINVPEGLFELLKIALYFVFLVIATLLILNDESIIENITRAFVIIALALSGIGICQFFGIAFQDLPGSYEVYATMANKNLLSESLFLTVPFLLYGILSAKGVWSVMTMLSLVTSGFVMGVIRARSSFVAIVMGLIFVIVFSTIFFKRLGIPAKLKSVLIKKFSYTVIVFVIITSLSTLTYFLYSFSTPLPKNPEEPVTDYAVQSVYERLSLWEYSIQIIRDYPLLGVGLGNWKIRLPQYGTEGLRSQYGQVYFLRPHNDFLWVFAETGIGGFISYTLILGLLFYYFHKIIFSSSSHQLKLLALVMLFGIIGYIKISLVAFPRERIVHSTFFFWMAAIIIAIYHKLFPLEKKIPSQFILPINLAFVIILLGCAFLGYVRLESEIHTKRALQYRKAQLWEKEIAEISLAESPLANFDQSATPLSYYSGLAQAKLNRIDEALSDFQTAYRFHPYHLAVISNLATAYERKGKLGKAVELFNKALEISPRHEHTLLNLTAVYFKMGNYQKAYEAIQRCDPKSTNPKVAGYRRAVEEKLKPESN